VASAPPATGRGAGFNERNRREFTSGEVRFTTKGKSLYAFVMGWPEKEAVIQPLAPSGPYGAIKVRNVELLGFKGKLQWKQEEAGLKVQMPAQKPSDHAICLKVALA